MIPARLEPKHSKQRHEISSSDRKIHFKRTLVLMKQHFSLEKESIFNLWQSNKTQHIFISSNENVLKWRLNVELALVVCCPLVVKRGNYNTVRKLSNVPTLRNGGALD